MEKDNVFGRENKRRFKDKLEQNKQREKIEKAVMFFDAKTKHSHHV